MGWTENSLTILNVSVYVSSVTVSQKSCKKAKILEYAYSKIREKD